LIAPAAINHLQGFWNLAPNNGSFNSEVISHQINHEFLRTIDRFSLSKLGETIAANWALAAGWSLKRQRLRRCGFELDLVIQKNHVFKIVEVKTRLYPIRTPDLELTVNWMNHKKVSALRRGAAFWLQECAYQKVRVESLECDLVAIDFKANQTIFAYRWPGACEISGK